MDGSTWVLLVALALFSISLLMHRFIDKDSSFLRLPITWFYASWLVGLTLLALPLYKYFEVFTAESSTYLIAILLSYSIGSISAGFWARRKGFAMGSKTADSLLPHQKPVTNRVVAALLVAGSVGTILLLINTVRAGGLSLADRLDSDNFAAIRSSYVSMGESHIGPFYGIATFMSAIGGLGVAFSFYLRGSRNLIFAKSKTLMLFATFVLMLNVIIGFIGFGSRMFAVFAILVGFIGFAEGRWAIGEKLLVKRITPRGFITIVLSAFVVLSLLWVSATAFLEKRVNHLDPQSLLYRTHRASFSPVLYNLTRGDQASQYFMFSLSYLTTPIPTLALYLNLPDSRLPGPFYGEYDFPAIARWSRRLTFSGDPYFWEKDRVEIFKPLGDIGFGTNVWSSLVRDLIADFGKSGALLFLSFLAFFSQRTYDLQRLSPSARRAGLLVYLRLLLAFAGLISILFQPHIHWPIYLAFVFALTPRKVRHMNSVGGFALDKSIPARTR